jgi:hypothetical protein
MEQDRLRISGESNIGLDPVCTATDRAFECGKRVLADSRRPQVESAVTQDLHCSISVQ